MRVLIFTIFLFLSVGMPQASYAAIVPDTACDSEFLDVIEARSWMEGKREMEAAQLIILKPDSVLEYSCFEQQLNALSSSSPWSNQNSHGNMSSGLQFVSAANTNFLNSNFGSPGGGTGSAFTCGSMNVIFELWDDMKCRNMDTVNFRTFQELEGADFRTLPNACNDPNRGSKWTAAIATTNPAPADPPTAGGVTLLNSLLGQLDPTACSGLSPIETGVIVQGTAPYADAVCSAPSCSYDGSGACQ